MPALLEAVSAFADAHGLLPPAARVLVGVSGGPDSSVLLHLLSRLAADRRFTVIAAHFHHGLRGPDADADAAAVRASAEALGVPYCIGRADAPLTPDEATLRAARYAWLGRAAAAHGASHVAVAHTREDQAETVLLRLLRGTGLQGLQGMRPARPLADQPPPVLVRPLLAAGRDAVLRYATEHGVTYRLDPTNEDRHRTRNRLRHEVLPLLRWMDPAVDERLARLADRLAEDEAYLAGTARALAQTFERGAGFGWVTYERPALAAVPSPLRTRILRQAFRAVAGTAYTPDAEATGAVARALTGDAAAGAADWPRGVRVRWTPADVVVARVPDPDSVAPVPLAVPGETPWPATAQRLQTHLRPGAGDAAPEPALRADWDRTPKPLVLRGWRDGDRWWPVGHTGPEPVGETLRRMGLPADRRPAAPVLTAEEQVWWVVGARPPEGAQTARTGGNVLEVYLD